LTSSTDWADWEARFEQFLIGETMTHDAAHDLEHIRRVVATARILAAAERADLAVVIPAAWLHDCVHIPKDSPLRSRASGLAAQAAVGFLRAIGYPESHLDAIHHAIEAHSFSANIPPRTRAAQVVQDADRLDALGAIGVARCLMLSGAIGRRLYDPHEPFPAARAPDDAINTVDHFYLKLLRLADTMTTPAGRAEAQRRTIFMRQFLEQLRSEIMPSLTDALPAHHAPTA
jgi:uncharacterized protein